MLEPAFLRKCDFYFISFRALASWSGQDVGLSRHNIPSRRAMMSSIFIPSTRAPMPCKFPWHPPVNLTFLTIPSSTSKSIMREHVPCVVYWYFIIYFLYYCPVNMHNHHKYSNLGLDKPHCVVKHHAESQSREA